MARPQKQGMDYFPVDVTFNDNMDYIIAEHGAEGLGIVIGLFQKIYRKGYYIEWNKKALSLFSQRINAGKDEIKKVVDSCFEENIFSKKLYEEYGILTSEGIQNRYLKMCKDCKRKNVTINRNYLLNIDSELTGVNEEETLVNSENSTQSKVKESKVKNNNIELQNDCNDDESYQEDIEDDKKDYEFDDESVEIQLARFMIKEMLRVKPDSRVPKDNIKSLQNWAKHIDYMIRLDNRKPREIAELFRWAQEDSFWCSNIRSPRKLREKWDSLELQMNNRKVNKTEKATENTDYYGW